MENECVSEWTSKGSPGYSAVDVSVDGWMQRKQWGTTDS